MAKAYMVVQFHSISDPEKLQAYSKLASVSIAAAGGRFIARGVAAKAMEAGRMERTVVVEFDSLAGASAAPSPPDGRRQ